MRKDTLVLVLLITLSFVFITIPCQAQITATQMDMYDFRVKQNLSPSDMDGTNDVTSKLQSAVFAARDARQTLFIPSGTYKISAQISCELATNATDGRPNIPVNIVGSSVKHPLIVLADNTVEFNGSNPRAVFHFWFKDPRYGTDWFMQGGIRGLDIDLGVGNQNAVGVYFSSAQHCYFEDINIKARSGFAGITGIGGANSLLANITVTGGKHGLYLPEYNEGIKFEMKGAPQNTITGCVFKDQSDIPVVIWCWGGFTMVGITIVTSSPTAIKLRCDGTVNVFSFSLIDSKIDFGAPGEAKTAIENLKSGYVSIRGLYTKGASTICNNNGDENLKAEDFKKDWTHVIRYNYVSKTSRIDNKTKTYLSARHYDAMTGVQSTTAISDQEIVSEPPSNLTSKHIWETTPSFEDPDAVLVTTAAEIQPAINKYRKVCLAKGDYVLTAPILLKSNTVLVGCPGIGVCGSNLKYGWNPAQPTWLIETENNAAATTYLLDITTDSGNIDYVGSLHWQAGKNSIVRNAWFDRSWDQYEKDLIRVYINGNGGGRFFNYQDEKGSTPASSSYRKVKIDGTSQQLTFYGLNLERGGNKYPESSFPMLEIESSANIVIFGAKTETSQPYASINNSQNIFITNVIDFAHFGAVPKNYFMITGAQSDRIEIANSMWLSSPDASFFVVKDPWNSTEVPRTMVLGCYHRNWSSIAASINVSTGVVNTCKKPDFVLYPTLVIDNMTVEVTDNRVKTLAYICNVTGQIVMGIELKSNRELISTINLPPGLYIFRLPTSSKKFIKI
jgi:hypothetical protein